MLQIPKWKIILSLVVTFLGILYAVPNVLPASGKAWLETHASGWMPGKTVNLGLDLRGGSHLLFQADMKSVVTDRIDDMEEAIRKELRAEKLRATDFIKTEDGISFTFPDPDQNHDAIYKILRDVESRAQIDVGSDGKASLTLNELILTDIKKKVISQSIEIVRRRIDETGTKEPLIQQQGTDRIVVQLPGVDDPSEIKKLVGTTAKMEFHMADEGVRPGPGSLKLPVKGTEGQSIYVKRLVALKGDTLTDSQAAFDQNNQPMVTLAFNSQGAKAFCNLSKENTGKVFAIVLDNEVISAPYFHEPICGGRGQISGHFTVKEANNLALLLRAGALPVPLTVVEERTVGPTLGSDSIAAGKHAAEVAFVLVFVLMAMTYGLFGIFADIALALNIVFIFAVLSLLQATLTLPGIAGIILTIGIAVDSNVLIYERIREEIRQGRTVLSSIDTGYKLALHTIIDANLTTLIVAMILFQFGSGPIKGFAVSMCIGIVTSLFSSIMLTRIMVLAWVKRAKPSTLTL